MGRMSSQPWEVSIRTIPIATYLSMHHIPLSNMTIHLSLIPAEESTPCIRPIKLSSSNTTGIVININRREEPVVDVVDILKEDATVMGKVRLTMDSIMGMDSKEDVIVEEGMLAMQGMEDMEHTVDMEGMEGMEGMEDTEVMEVMEDVDVAEVMEASTLSNNNTDPLKKKTVGVAVEALATVAMESKVV